VLWVGVKSCWFVNLREFEAFGVLNDEGVSRTRLLLT
jgi:hypothetical protein